MPLIVSSLDQQEAHQRPQWNMKNICTKAKSDSWNISNLVIEPDDSGHVPRVEPYLGWLVCYFQMLNHLRRC
jgi:hypothetical protein